MHKVFPNGYRLQVVLALLVLAAGACSVRQERRVELQGSTPTLRTPTGEQRQPTITASPTEENANGWQVASADAVTLTVTAPGASEVTTFYRPVAANEGGDYLQLRKLIEPTERASGRFQTNLQTSTDFAGDVWAHVTYSDGAEKQTAQMALTTRTAIGASERPPAPMPNTDGNAARNETNSNRTTPALGEDESARSDRAMSGRIMRAALRPNDPEIRITVNVPAFLLTLWQGDKEIATYPVGVGREKFPVPISERTASRVILNPAWIPPDSEWVRASSGVEPYERIPASDPQNPLGKIKIPLGDAYLIHEAAAPSDIGNLVSHGCVRVLRDDLFDLVRKIARARSLQISNEEIDGARNTSERRVIELNDPLTVDINYDTHVIEGGVLHLYPDVYHRGTNIVERLRAELERAGVAASRLDDATLRGMLERLNDTQQFVVSLTDIRRGRALERGKTQPLTPQQANQIAQSDESEKAWR